MNRLIVSLVALAMVGACDGSPVAPDVATDAAADVLVSDDAWFAGAGPGAMPLRVFQQNVYPGFSIDAVQAALASGDPELALMALTNGLLVFEQTNWRERAAAMALEIQRQDPDVVNLNEMVTVVRIGFNEVSPFLPEPLATYWSMIPSDSTDFLPIFLEELDKLGLEYEVVKVLPLTNAYVPVPLPGVPPEYFPHARYMDADVMLVRHGVTTGAVVADTFAVTQSTAIAEELRGWIAADVTRGPKTWRVVATHPEPSWPAGGETPQITELLNALAGTTLPVMVTGDLNFLPSSAQYAQMTGAGFADLWTFRKDFGTNPGYTCCRQVETLDAPLSSDPLTERKDYVWVRAAGGYEVGPVNFRLFGDDPSERTAHDLWPSDHLGLSVGVVLQKEK
jgi:endonuclease/exonuclease/phosphatase family metal-dependent hydrolase